MSVNIVAVTACPTGIAHSQMGAEGLERAAANAGHDIRIEVQGAFGVDDELTDEDIERADVAIVAADVRVDTDRFSDAALPVVEVPVSNAVTDPDGVIDRARSAADSGNPTTAEPSGPPTVGTDETGSSRSFIQRLRQLL